MNLPTFIIQRDLRTEYRKKRKEEWDKIIDLSVTEDETPRSFDVVPLLDDGMALDAGGKPWFYVKRGTVRRFYESLSDDYVGYINLAHLPLEKFPFILGTWTKKDLFISEHNGVERLSVRLNLDEDSIFVKELRKLPFTLCISAETGVHISESLTKKLGIDVWDDVSINGFSVVGNAGNVNSSGIKLGGEDMTLEQMSAALDGETTDLNAINQKLAALIEEEESKKQLTTAEEEAAKEEPVGEAKDEKPEEEPEEPKEVAAEQSEEEKEELAAVEKMFNELTAKLETLSTENAKLQARLEAKEKAERDFVEKFKNLSVSLSTESVTEVADEPAEQNVFSDGIGEF